MDEQQALKRIASQRRRRKWRKRVTIGLLAFLAIALAGGYVALTLRGRSELDDAIAEAERDNGPWRLDDLEGKREGIPDAENSYHLLVKTKQLLPSNWPFWDYPRPIEGNGLSQEQLEELKELFAADLEPNVQLDQRQIDGLSSKWGHSSYSPPRLSPVA